MWCLGTRVPGFAWEVLTLLRVWPSASWKLCAWFNTRGAAVQVIMKLYIFFSCAVTFRSNMQMEWVMLVLFLFSSFPSVKKKLLNKNEAIPPSFISTRLLLADSFAFIKYWGPAHFYFRMEETQRLVSLPAAPAVCSHLWSPSPGLLMWNQQLKRLWLLTGRKCLRIFVISFVWTVFLPLQLDVILCGIFNTCCFYSLHLIDWKLLGHGSRLKFAQIAWV